MHYSTTNIFLSLFQIPGVLAAVDATKEQEIGKRYKIEGFPTGEKTVACILSFAFPLLNALSVNHNTVVILLSFLVQKHLSMKDTGHWNSFPKNA